jgi:lipopolysaccharide biosynthesis glycosyltransferase
MGKSEGTSYNIITTSDNGFAQHTGVMLASLISNNPDCSFQVYILVPVDFSEENVSKVVASFEGNSGAVRFVQVPDDLVNDLKIDGHATRATYLRLCIGALLPAALDRVLYLDSDIIIRGDITNLFHMDLLGFPFGAVPDAVEDADRKIRTKISLGATARYFNAGVLSIDLPRWRSFDIEARAISYCRSNGDAITWWDQCALNHVVNGQFYVLDEKWNFQSKSSRRHLRSALIIHFTGAIKPWHARCNHPLKNLYFEFVKKTPWKDFTLHRTHRDLIWRILGPLMYRAAAATFRRIKIWLVR